MHDTTDGSHWHEPEGLKNAGYGAWKRPNTPYDDYMEAQGIPIYRGIGVRRVQDMPLKRWNRMGGNGTFIQLYGTEGRWGCYVVEVPRAGALNPERHMYEEIMVVVEGRGTTEIWTDDQKRPHSFEWQRGSMFSIPLNTWHRIVNAASSPALILVASTAPNVMNLFRDSDWIFNCPITFPSRYDGTESYFKPKDDIMPDPLRGLAMRKTNLIPDVFNAELYLDNRRSPGYRRMEPNMAGNVFYGLFRFANSVSLRNLMTHSQRGSGRNFEKSYFKPEVYSSLSVPTPSFSDDRTSRLFAPVLASDEAPDHGGQFDRLDRLGEVHLEAGVQGAHTVFDLPISR